MSTCAAAWSASEVGRDRVVGGDSRRAGGGAGERRRGAGRSLVDSAPHALPRVAARDTAGAALRWHRMPAARQAGALRRQRGRRAGPLGADEVFAVHPEMAFGWKPRQWAAIELARRLRRRWLRPLEVRERAGTWLVAARKMRAEARDVRTSLPDPRALLDSFELHLRRLLQRAQAHADRVLVLRQPWFEKEYTAEEAACLWHGGMGKAWKQTITTYFSLNVVNQVVHLLDARAARVAEALGIEHRDLRNVLAPSLEYYYDYMHYTPAGAAVVAREVAAALLRPPATGAAETLSPCEAAQVR